MALLGAACSSSSHEDGQATTTTAGGSSTSAAGASTTRPAAHPTTTVPVTTAGTGTPVTKPGGSPVTTPGGVQVTTPAPTTTPPVTAPPVSTQWKLAVDFRTRPGQNPFPSYIGGTPVWSLRQSASRQRNGNYSLLPSFSSTFGTRGVAAWHSNASGCDNAPAIGSATIDAPLTVCGASIPGNATFVYPDSSHMPVVAWTSPFAGTVRISAAAADLDGRCGDGVEFYIDRGTTNLSDIRLVNRDARTVKPITTKVSSGQSVYFIVDAGPSGNTDCDTTQLAASVDKVG
jgi:hypothetical protein